MRIIKETALTAAARAYPDSTPSLASWVRTVRAAGWQSLAAVRGTYPHADAVRVASGRTAIIFNIAGNKYRLITALHFDRGIAYILCFLNHAEYSKDRWKSVL